MVQRLWRNPLTDLEQIVELHHGSVTGPDIDARDVIGVRAIARCHLNDHVVLLAIVLVTGHLPATQHGFQCASHCADVHPHIRELFTVDLNAQLWGIHAQVHVDVLQPRILAQLIHIGRDHFEQLGIGCLAHHDEVDRLGAGPQPKRWWIGWERPHARELCKLGLKLFGNILLLA